ncbi:MAG: 1-phosphofructokinase [Lachnospiraceae bacterium]|jgi:1-phosphofructokinase|nr:1-phosphofructokinase [Lachnospiraceae bacterium]
MIITVTMNPAIDKTIDIERLERGGLNRIKNVEMDAGGKGINVSKTIHALGGSSLATGFLGGKAGEMIESVLCEYGIKTDFIHVDGETRTNTKVVEALGEVTELNEPGPVVTKEQVEALLEKLEGYGGADTLVVLAGSIPKGVDPTIYKEITERVHKKGGKVLMDADGELFIHGLEAYPDMIKPNRMELEAYYHLDYRASESELVSMGKRLLAKGSTLAAISLGQMGALFLREDKAVRCPGLTVKAHSTVGAGDAMVAALAYSWDQKLPFEETIRLAMAASAGAVTTIGTKPPAREVVDELAKQVTVEPVL